MNSPFAGIAVVVLWELASLAGFVAALAATWVYRAKGDTRASRRAGWGTVLAALGYACFTVLLAAYLLGGSPLGEVKSPLGSAGYVLVVIGNVLLAASKQTNWLAYWLVALLLLAVASPPCWPTG